MGSKHEESDPSELLKPVLNLWTKTFNFMNSFSMKCAIELGIPEIIHKHGQPITLPDLISALPIHPTKSKYVPRLMTHLVHLGFFQVQNEADDDPNRLAYSLTPTSSLLVKDSPFCLTPFVSFFMDPVAIKPLFDLSTWFQNDDASPFKTSHGEEFYDRCRKDPRLGGCLNECMASDSKMISIVVVSKCREVFDGLKSVVDVGGGTGTMGRAIAEAFPHLEYTVFDQPHVVAGLQGKENLKYVGGNMFESIPPADAVLLKLVLVDWSDENCVKILKRCKESITSEGRAGKLIIIEPVVDHEDEEFIEIQIITDMVLMAIDGKNRSEADWGKLFCDAGFSSYKIHPELGMKALIEVFP